MMDNHSIGCMHYSLCTSAYFKPIGRIYTWKETQCHKQAPQNLYVVSGICKVL